MFICESPLNFFTQYIFFFNLSLLKLETNLDYLPIMSDTDYQATSDLLYV